MSYPRAETQVLPTNEVLVARLFSRRRAMEAAERDPGNPKLAVSARNREENAGVEVRRATLLVPEDRSTPVTGVGFHGARVLWAFTDSEAYEAWRGSHGAALTADWAVRPVRGAKRELGAIMEAVGVAYLVVNPAGPAGLLQTPEQYRSSQRTLIWTKPKIDEPMVAEGARATARAEMAELLQAAERSLRAGAFDDFRSISNAASEAADRFGDTYAQSEIIQLVVEKPALASSDTPSVLARGWWDAARYWGLLGETRRCAEDLMASGRLALSTLEAGTEPQKDEWFRQVLSFVADNLPLLGLEDLAEDCREARTWSDRFPLTETGSLSVDRDSPMRGVKRRALTPEEREEALEIARRHGLGRVISGKALGGLAVILALVLGGLAVITSETASSIAGHAGDHSRLWAAFGIAATGTFLAIGAWVVRYLQLPGRPPTDRQLLAFVDKTRGGIGGMRSVVVVAAVAGPSLIGLVLGNADAAAPLLGALVGLGACSFGVFSWVLVLNLDTRRRGEASWADLRS